MLQIKKVKLLNQMKFLYLMFMLCCIFLTACGDEAKDTKEVSKVSNTHFFDQPYECSHESQVTSKRTGKTRDVKYRSYYSPQKGWRIDLSNVENTGDLRVANLYTPSARYDGTYKETDRVLVSVKFATAWPRKVPKPDIALSNLSKKKKKNCKVLDDISIFDIDYLGSLEVMGE